MAENNTALLAKVKKLEQENSNLKEQLSKFNNLIENQKESNSDEFKILVEQQNELIAKIDTSGNFLYINPTFCKNIGKTKEELFGSNLYSHIHPEDVERSSAILRQLETPPHVFYTEQRIKTIEGWIWMSWSDKAIFDNNRKIKEIIVIGRNINSRKKAQLTLHKHVKEMDTLNRFLRRLMSSLTIEDVINSTVDSLSNKFENTLVAFYMKNDKNNFVCKKNNNEKFNFSDDIFNDPKIILEIKNVSLTNRIVTFDSDKNKNLISTNPQSIAILPCSTNNQIVSCLLLCVFSPEHSFDSNQTFLETLSNEISVSLQNALLYDEIKVHSIELSKANKDLLLEISEREKAEKSMKINEEKFRNLFENAADGIIIFDTDENILEVNDSFCQLINRDKNQLKCSSFSKLFVYIDPSEINDIFSNDTNLLKQNILLANGETRAVEIHIKPFRKNTYQAFFRDVSDRNFTEQKLIETNNLLQAINNASPDVIFILNLGSRKLSFHNRRFNEIFQYSENEIKNTADIFNNLCHPDDKRISDYHLKKILKAQDNQIVESEIRLMRKDNKIIWSLIREQVFMRDSQGNVIETVGVINDISERKKAEDDIILTNNFLQAIFHTSPDVIFVSDYSTQNIFYISRKIENISLYSLQHCINSKNIIEELVYKEDRSLYFSSLDKIKKTEKDEHLEFEFRLKRKDKKIIWVRVVMIVFKTGENDEILQTLGILSEITERKMALQKIMESETKFRNIFNSSTNGIAILNKDFTIIESNDSFTNLVKQRKEKLFKMNILEFFEQGVHSKLKPSMKKSMDGKSSPVTECELIQSEKHKIPVEISFKPINFEDSNAVLVIVHNISERKEAEKKVFDAIIVTEEKERETFAKNLHDDLGPLLSSIRMYLNSFQDTQNKEKQTYIVQQVNSILKEAIQCTKEVSNDLSPHILTNYGLESAIESFISNFSDLMDIKFVSNVSNLRFENIIETTIFRISKELINNTLKHAGASKIEIVYSLQQNLFKMSYLDNGKGFNFDNISSSESSGMGVFNIKNRVKTLNGKISSGKTPVGIKLNIEIPVSLKTND